MSGEDMPSCRALSCEISTCTTLPGSFQSNVGASRCGLSRMMPASSCACARKVWMSGPLSRYCIGPADRRSEIERMHEDVHADELLARELAQPRLHAGRVPRATW